MGQAQGRTPGRMGRGVAQREMFQAAEHCGDEGEEHRLHEVQACARGCAFRFRGMAQAGEHIAEVGCRC